MCTGQNSMAASSTVPENFWQDALCVLHGFKLPFQVLVCSEIPSSLGGFQRRTICVTQEGAKRLKSKYKLGDLFSSVDRTFFVPELCVVPSVKHIPCPPGFKEENTEFGRICQQIPLANVHQSDLLVWAPPAAKHYDLELFPCTLTYAGVTIKEPCTYYAYICIQKTVYKHNLRDSYNSRKTEGDGWLYQVPLNQIYRWEDINQTSRQVSQYLSHAKLEYVKSRKSNFDLDSCYEFFYRIPERQEHSSNFHSELNKTCTDSSMHELQEQRIGPGLHLTKSKITDDEKTDGLVKSHEAKAGSSNNGFGPYLVTEKEERNDWSYSAVVAAGERKTSHAENSRSDKIVVFGNCFLKDTKYKLVSDNGVQVGDAVIASVKDGDDIVGEVTMICECSQICTKTKPEYVAVTFENKINTEPFEVRHAWGWDESMCVENCSGDTNVLIPLEYFVGTECYRYKTDLRVLKGSEDKSKTRRKSLLTSDIKVDFHYEANRMDFVFSPIEIVNREKIKEMGIEGNANSCYIDAVLFALYAFTAKFDQGLLHHLDSDKHSDEMNVKIEAARKVLKYDIVSPLRSSMKVGWENVYKLRVILADILNDKSYLSSFMDAEAFIFSLFSQVLQVPPFFEFGEDSSDYILQLFPPMTEDTQLDLSHVQFLIQEYCGFAEVKLQKVPKSGFIVKLPVSDGVPHFQFVYPNPKLRLGKRLLEKKDKSEKSVDLNLSAVICLKNNHFTCFVRKAIGTEEQNFAWYFHDSMAAGKGSSILTECPSLEEALEIVAPRFGVKVANTDHSKEGCEIPKEANDWLDILLTTAYICLYEPPYEETFV